MIVSAIGLAILVVLVVVLAGGFLLRLTGRISILLGLLGAAFVGDPVGLLVAAVGAGLLALGRSRALDRRRHAYPVRAQTTKET
jgi:hypothetical protein